MFRVKPASLALSGVDLLERSGQPRAHWDQTAPSGEALTVDFRKELAESTSFTLSFKVRFGWETRGRDWVWWGPYLFLSLIHI